MDQETRDKMCNDCQDALDNALGQLYHNYEHFKEDLQELERKIRGIEFANVSTLNDLRKIRPEPLELGKLEEFIQQSKEFFAKYKQHARSVESAYEKAEPEINRKSKGE